MLFFPLAISRGPRPRARCSQSLWCRQLMSARWARIDLILIVPGFSTIVSRLQDHIVLLIVVSQQQWDCLTLTVETGRGGWPETVPLLGFLREAEIDQQPLQVEGYLWYVLSRDFVPEAINHVASLSLLTRRAIFGARS